jgi:hypothetical protein
LLDDDFPLGILSSSTTIPAFSPKLIPSLNFPRHSASTRHYFDHADLASPSIELDEHKPSYASRAAFVFKLQLDKLRNEREAKVIKQNDELFDKVQAKADELPEAAQGAYVDVFATSLDKFDDTMGVITETVIKFFFSAVDQLKNIVLAAVEQVKKVANLVAKGVKKVGKWFGSLFRSVAIGAVLLDSGVLEAGLPVQVAVGGAATVLVYDTELGSMTEMTEYNNGSLSKHLTYSVHDERMAISHDAVYDKDGMIVQLLTNSEVGGKYMFWVHSIGKK